MAKPLGWRQQKEMLTRFLLRWRTRLWLTNWTIHVLYEEAADTPVEGAGASQRLHAEVFTTWEYREATIKINKRWLSGVQDEEEIENLVIHELTHLKLAPLKNLAEQFIEMMPVGERAAAREHLRQMNEMTTTDIAYNYEKAYHWSDKDGED